jgi:diguanylate cyclase (GGDEF)-like protein/PAS domain S-box-containing protein
MRQCWVSHENRLNGAKTETANLVRSIAEHAHDTFMIADKVLLSLREQVVIDGAGPAAIARLEQTMRADIAGRGLIRGMFLINEHGAWLAHSASDLSHDVTYADRDYFRYHRNVADEHVRISAPVHSKVDGGWVVPVTRRVNHSDGSFAGVVGTTIATEVFQSNFRGFDIGRQGVITMTNGERLVMAQQPFDDSNVGRDSGYSQLFRNFAPDIEAQSIQFNWEIDGKPRIGSLQRVPGFDLIIVVSREKNEVLAEWKRETQLHLTWMTFALLALVMLAWRKIVLIRKAARTQALYRLLADNSSDAIVCLGRDGRRRYVSPSFWMMTGWTEAYLLATSFSDLVVAEDRPIAAAAFAELMAGTAQVTAVYRYRCSDGTAVWVELLARPTTDPLGGPSVFVGNIRNISRQKAAEEQLAATNAELAAISRTDSLTGIANRRHFDEVLLKEWRRAIRGGTDLALLLVDADHFKAYNDAYGHPQGDACLRAIALTLAASIRRPGDLAARYGGEEFAVILPETSVEAAAAMADLMRQTLADQAMEHRINEAGVVTVSIGVAALVPQRGSEPESLIKLADKALYEAKRIGRNRVAFASREALPEQILLLG